MEKECTLFKCLMIIVSFFPLLDTTLTIKIDKVKKDNHTIKNLTKVYDQRTSSSNFRMHGLHPMFGNGPDQLKTLYTNLGSSNNQVQLKYINPKYNGYITGTGLLSSPLSPLTIIRASDLSLAPEQLQQTNGLPEFLNDYNNLNQEQNQFLMRPIKDQLFQSRPELFQQDALTKVKRQRKKRKKRPIFKFNEQDSMEFNKHNSMEFSNKHNSMEFNRHNSMEFPNSNSLSFKKRPRKSFEKSYDELVNSAKKLADTIENISTDEDGNLESDIKDLSSAKKMSSEIDKFNFDEIKLNQKDEDELENLSTFGNKKNMNTETFNEFDSVEENKNAYSSSGDDQTEKFSDLFNQNFGDLFNDENGDKYGDDKLYDKIIGKINGDKKKKEKFSTFDEFSNDEKKTTMDKKKKKKKPPADDDSNNQQQFSKDENKSDELMQNNKESNQENQDQTEYNTNTSGHVDTGEYDYAGYAKDPSEQYDDQQPTTELTNENEENPDKGSPDKYEKDSKPNDKYQGEPTTSPPIVEGNDNNYNSNYKGSSDGGNGDYKEQPPPQSTGEEQNNTESEGRSFRNPLGFRNTLPPFTRLTIRNAKNSITKLSGLKDKLTTNNKKSSFVNVNVNPNFNQFDSTFTGRKGKKVVRVRSKRIQ